VVAVTTAPRTAIPTAAVKRPRISCLLLIVPPCAAEGGSPFLSWAYKRLAREEAADDPHVALGHLQCVPDVARTIAIDVADLRVTERRLPARAQIHVVLRREERIRDVDDPISIDIAARDLRRRGCGAARGRATRRGGRLSRRRGQGGARRGSRCRRLSRCRGAAGRGRGRLSRARRRGARRGSRRAGSGGASHGPNGGGATLAAAQTERIHVGEQEADEPRTRRPGDAGRGRPVVP